MIQLRRAKVENFRLLRDIELEFSVDFEHPVTVVRAENDTGKTTLLHALRWGLFGDDALPGSRSAFRLHPIDWQRDLDGDEAEIKVTIEFVAVDEESDTEVTYEVERRTKERVVGETEFDASHATVTLLRHTHGGMELVENPSAMMESLLPTSLRDVFFIDGDRALTFIESTDEQRVKRERVEKAVRALLGLDLLEEAKRHVDLARREAVASIRKLGAGTDLEDLVTCRQKLEEEHSLLEQELVKLSEDYEATDQRHKRADQKFKDALAAGAGSQRELGIKLDRAEKSLEAERQTEKTLLKAHRDLLNLPFLTVALAPTRIADAAGLLQHLEEKKVIPSTLPEVIEDRLARGECICGTALPEGSLHRAHLEESLAEARQIDEPTRLLQSLNEGVKRTMRELAGDDPWAERLRASQAGIQGCLQRKRDLEAEVAELHAQVKNVGETNLDELEGIVRREQIDAKRLHGEIARKEQMLHQKAAEITDVDRKRTVVQRQNEKVRSGVNNENAAKDVLDVIHSTIRVLENETLDEVSEKMNEIFLKMIVADEQAGSVIQKAVLTHHHDIVVEGPGGRTLDPDTDLNGASRRALTLAFILALVKVSGVKAPNVIDTPLGMMGIEVRQAVVRYAALHSSQLVLLLTGSEILGVEALLDEYAGSFYTFTNATHYPTKLVNEPASSRAETLVCTCTHRKTCDQCRRRISATASLAEV